jgi:hypothetical protein
VRTGGHLNLVHVRTTVLANCHPRSIPAMTLHLHFQVGMRIIVLHASQTNQLGRRSRRLSVAPGPTAATLVAAALEVVHCPTGLFCSYLTFHVHIGIANNRLDSSGASGSVPHLRASPTWALE